MTIKILGAILIITGCASFGFLVCAVHRKETEALRSLMAVLDIMECELQYRLTPLPELCRRAAGSSSGIIKRLMTSLSDELDAQVAPDAERCVHAVLNSAKDVPELTAKAFQLLAKSLGQFDLDGQLKGIEMARSECKQLLEHHTRNQDNRLRCYQTLGLCAGAAMAILLI